MTQRAQNQNQIIRKDGANTFVEILSSGFPIGKVLMNFIQYDKNAAAGSKQTAVIKVYFDFSAFYQLTQDLVVNQKILKRAHAEGKKAKDSGSNYYNGVTLYQGGTSATQLQRQNRSRQDGKSESRMCYVKIGDKKPILLMAQQGAGVESETGLIKPQGQPEKKVMVPLKMEDLTEMMLITQAHIQAFLNAQYAKEYDTLFSKNSFSSDTPKNNYQSPQTDYYSKGGYPENNYYQDAPDDEEIIYY